jgi:N-acyl-D-aspartate/D-glutamate deacylase
MDVYPYDSSGSDGSFCALPPWAIGGIPQEGRPSQVNHGEVLRATLAKSDNLERLRQDVRHQLALKGGPENVRILDFPRQEYVGRTYAELMKERGLDETGLAIALQLEGHPQIPGGAKMRSFSMAEEDIEAFYRLPWCATTTDGWIVLPEEAVGPYKYVGTNRRCFGSYPRRLVHYALERGVDTLEQAVRSCSGLPAEILGLNDRGRIAVGMKADIALINLRELRDNTTFMEPNLYASGVEHVFVNGVAVVSSGKPTLALPGVVLEPPGRPVQQPNREVKSRSGDSTDDGTRQSR